MEINKEKSVKIILALFIVVSHLPIGYFFEKINYLPVAAFLFFSGYGLMKKNNLGRKFNFFKSFIKIYIPYIMITFIYLVLFSDVNLLLLLKNILLINIDLPYSWYVRTQILLYIIWFLSQKFNSNIKKIYVCLLLIIIYIIIFYLTGQIFTSYKTIFCFLFGVIYAYNEKKLKNFDRTHFIGAIIFLLLTIVMILNRNSYDLFDFLLYNISGLFFCEIVYYFILNYNFEFKILNNIKNIYYEIYLVQGISQCIFMKTYFCNKSFLYLQNKLLILILSFSCTIVFAILLKKIDDKIFNIIYKRKEV